MSEQLYRKTGEGKRVRYVPVDHEEPTCYMNLTDGQCITAAASLGVTLLTIFERNIPPHKRVARKIKAVEAAILDLFHGTGEKIDADLSEFMCRAWDQTMKNLSYDGEVIQ